jgi:hypothetical protein
VGLGGIALIVFGGYFIHFNWTDVRQGKVFASLLRLRYERGSQYLLVVALLFGVVATANRHLVTELGPWVFLYWWFISLVIVNTLLVLPRLKSTMSQLLRFSPYLLPIHGWYVVMVIADTMGLTFAIAPLVFAVKRIEILFTVVIGAVVFKEHNIAERLLGVLFMGIGLTLVVLWG